MNSYQLFHDNLFRKSAVSLQARNFFSLLYILPTFIIVHFS